MIWISGFFVPTKSFGTQNDNIHVFRFADANILKTEDDVF